MRHGEKQLKEVFALLAAVAEFNGQPLDERECPPVFGNDTLGQVGALYQKLGREVLEALRRGDVKIVMENDVAKVIKAIKPFVDGNGVFIPGRGITAKVTAAHWQFDLGKTTVVYEEVIEALSYAFERKDFPSATELQERLEQLKAALLADERFCHLIDGQYACPLITVIPPTPVDDYGQTLWQKYVPALARVYARQFPGRAFNDYRKDSLVGQVTVLAGTHHDKVVKLAAEGFVPGLFFPNAMQGWSVLAQRQLIATLPGNPFQFSLGGGIDTFSAWMGNIGVTARDFNAPGQDMSALQWREPSYSLYFGAGGGRLDFGGGAGLGDAGDDVSGGFFVFG